MRLLGVLVLLLALPASASAATWSDPRVISEPHDATERLYADEYVTSYVWEDDGSRGSTLISLSGHRYQGLSAGLLPFPAPTTEGGPPLQAGYADGGRITADTGQGVVVVAEREGRIRSPQFAADYEGRMTVAWLEGPRAFIVSGTPDEGFGEPRVLASGPGIRNLTLRSAAYDTAVAWERGRRVYARWRFGSDGPLTPARRIGTGRTRRITLDFYNRMGIAWTTAAGARAVTKQRGRPLRRVVLARRPVDGLVADSHSISWAAGGRVHRFQFGGYGAGRRFSFAAPGARVQDAAGVYTGYTRDGALWVNDVRIAERGEFRQVRMDASTVIAWINGAQVKESSRMTG